MIATNGYLPIILHYCFPVNNKKRIDLSPIPRYNEKCREVGDRVLFVDEGRIIEEGTPKEIFENPKQERTKLFLSKILVKMLYNQ